jgi:hypothetical protein
VATRIDLGSSKISLIAGTKESAARNSSETIENINDISRVAIAKQEKHKI